MNNTSVSINIPEKVLPSNDNAWPHFSPRIRKKNLTDAYRVWQFLAMKGEFVHDGKQTTNIAS
jgi:hypothetical protein